MARPLPTYTGPFGPAQAERLLWRAGFGPRPGEVEALAARGLRGAVAHLLSPGPEVLAGGPPTDGKGRPLAPGDAWGHEHLWWLDRMARTNRHLTERMTLVWHDWFATSREAASGRLMLRQNALLRRHALGSFRTLTLEVTRDPAMLLWLSGSSSTKDAPNENYARELMELFTLGAGRGYTERDVREQARALTGFANDWDDAIGAHRFRFERRRHDGGVKRVFGKRGRFDWRDAVELCLDHPKHPSHVVRRLWSAFVPTPPSKADQAALERLYVRRGLAIRPLVEKILLHPDLHEGPRMVKPPAVHLAGMLRARERGVDTDSWTWISTLAGQVLFLPPDVAGWDETRWLDTGTLRGRWIAASAAAKPGVLTVDHVDVLAPPEQVVDEALAFWGSPHVTDATRQELLAFARDCHRLADRPWKARSFASLRVNALRMLVATSPDFLTS